MLSIKDLNQLTDIYKKMNFSDLLERSRSIDVYKELIDIINYHNKLYYIDETPLISDAEHDYLLSLLKQYETQFPEKISSQSPTQRLTNQIQKEFHQASHRVPLLSLENSYNAEDLRDWSVSIEKLLAKNTIQDIVYGIEPKFDGVTIELVYKKNVLVQAITRGDGFVGEDVTQNVRTIKSIPLKIISEHVYEELRVRGEILLPKDILKEINIDREGHGEVSFANTRNAASGSMRQLDSNVTAKRSLVCYIYDLLYIDNDIHFVQQEEFFSFIKGLGFSVFNYFHRCESIEEVIRICEDVHTKNFFDEQNIDFDGLVIKVLDFRAREILGMTAHHPRRAMAYKFPAKLVSTRLESVEFQVGRTGAITPVAHVEETLLGGVKISRASLHNFDFVAKKDILIGDYVRLQRSGEVIPYIVGPIKERRDKPIISDHHYLFDDGELYIDHDLLGKKKYNTVFNDSLVTILPPIFCPVCGNAIYKNDDEAGFFCTNISCPAQVIERIIHFVSKECMNIEGMGESIVRLLISSGIIHNVADLYRLSDQANSLKIMSLPGIDKKKYHRLIIEIESSKKQPLRRIINALGISHVGKKTSQLIVTHLRDFIDQHGVTFTSVDELMRYLQHPDFLSSIKGIGPETIESISHYLSSEKNIFLLHTLEQNGVDFTMLGEKQIIQGVLSGINVCITGSFSLSREQIRTFIQQHGGVVDDDIFSHTNLLIVGEKPGSKLAKAHQKNITVVSDLESYFASISPQLLSEYKKLLLSLSSVTISQPSLF